MTSVASCSLYAARLRVVRITFERGPDAQHILGGLIFVAIGYILLASVKSVAGRYIGVFMIACTNAAVIPFIAYRTATVTGATSTAIATGGVIAIANIAGAVAPYLFRAKDAPHYYPGLWTLFSMLAAACCIVGFLWYKLGASSEYRGGLDEPLEAQVERIDGDEDGAPEKKVDNVEPAVQEVPRELKA